MENKHQLISCFVASVFLMALDTATLDALLETTEDPIIVLDTADGVVDCNEAARGLASIDDEWAGLSVRDFLSAVPSLADDIVSGSLDGATYTLTVDGTERVFDPTISHIEVLLPENQLVALEQRVIAFPTAFQFLRSVS